MKINWKHLRYVLLTTVLISIGVNGGTVLARIFFSNWSEVMSNLVVSILTIVPYCLALYFVLEYQEKASTFHFSVALGVSAFIATLVTQLILQSLGGAF